MTDNHVCQYGKCEDPPKYKIGTETLTFPTVYRELLICEHHLELMKKSIKTLIMIIERI